MKGDALFCIVPIMIIAVLYSLYRMMKDLEEYACAYKNPDTRDDEKI
jgi:hypothetical protein